METNLADQSTIELLKQAGVIGGGGLLSIGLAYLALVKTSLITRPKVIAEQAAYIDTLHQRINDQDKVIATHEKQFATLQKQFSKQEDYINELRSQLAEQRGVQTQEIPQPEAMQ